MPERLRGFTTRRYVNPLYLYLYFILSRRDGQMDGQTDILRQHSAVKILEVSLFLRGHSVRRFLCFVYMECTFPKVHTYADLKYKR